LSRINIIVRLSYKRVIDVSPTCKPRGAPNRNITLSDLVETVGFEYRQNLDNRSPEGRFGSI
jgi:hypothetical protein